MITNWSDKNIAFTVPLMIVTFDKNWGSVSPTPKHFAIIRRRDKRVKRTKNWLTWLQQPWSGHQTRDRLVAAAAASTAGASAAGGSRYRGRARPWGGGSTASEPSETSSGAAADRAQVAENRLSKDLAAQVIYWHWKYIIYLYTFPFTVV